MSAPAAASALRLGVLDFGQYFGTQTADELLAATRAFARQADRLGYSRYWLAEHHEPAMAWAVPELLVPLLADGTRHLRVGTAGILLSFYSPWRVAETFALLERLHPGRIDCGLAAGVSIEPVRGALRPGFDPVTEHHAGTYGHRIAELLGYLRREFPADHRFAAGPVPVGTDVSSVWLLGIGHGNRILASRHGTAFSHSLIHGPGLRDPAIIRAYRDEFRPSRELGAPRCNVAVSVICADDEAAARAQERLFLQYTNGSLLVNVCGTPEQCREQLLELAARYAVDEIVILSVWHDLVRREASYGLLAEALRLPPPPEPAAGPSLAGLQRLSYHFNPPRAAGG